MIERDDDDRVRSAFRALRAEVEASGRVPDFDDLMARARAAATGPLPGVPGDAAASGRAGGERRRLVPWGGGWAAAAAAAAVAALILVDGRSDADAEFTRLVAAYSAEAGVWRSPTSGLLDVPGMDLVRSVPAVGSSIRGLDATDVRRAPEAGRDS